MTPPGNRVTRRAFVAGAGAVVVGAGVVGARELLEDRSPTTRIPVTDTGAAPVTGVEETCDLTVRWRYLERRVSVPDLIAAWDFDEPTGYAFTDVSGHGQSLHITGNAWNTSDSGLLGAIHRAGRRGLAVHLDGTRWLEAAPGPFVLAGATNFTVTCWVRPDDVTSPADLVRLPGCALALAAGGLPTASVRTASGRLLSLTGVGDYIPLIAGSWAHLAVVVSGSTGELRLYVDGHPTGSRQVPPFAPASSGSGRGVVVGAKLVGALDETTIHSKALTAGEIRRQYVVGLPTVFTQSSESLDGARERFTRWHGSDPVPHAADDTTVFALRFAGTVESDGGLAPLGEAQHLSFVPGPFRGSWESVGDRLTYRSPLSGGSGTFEAWLRPVLDMRGPDNQGRRDVFSAVGPASNLTLFMESGQWGFALRQQGSTVVRHGPRRTFLPGVLEHVALAWGSQVGDHDGIALYGNGIPEAFLESAPAHTLFTSTISLGGGPDPVARVDFDDVRISSVARPWGAVCPRGHASSGTAGLDLRDTFDRPPGAEPMLWRPASTGPLWSHRRMVWRRPELTGDDPATAVGLFQGSPDGLHPTYHPDAWGLASSIEAGVSFDAADAGWAGLFVASPDPHPPFSGLTFMISQAGRRLRLARYVGGRVDDEKVLPHDFPIRARTTYEMTLTSGPDGVVRGFVDGTNVISMRRGPGWPREGYGGMLTDGARAFFSALHFCALTPPSPSSRTIRTRLLPYGAGAGAAELALTPFSWQKRRGLLPWLYRTKNPEPPGNIAGGATVLPKRPIRPAPWRSGDSANSDLVVVNGRVLYFMRGTTTGSAVDRPVSSIGVLFRSVDSFDGVHFFDPNADVTSNVPIASTLLSASVPASPADPGAPLDPAAEPTSLNAPSTAYVGAGRLLFVGRESPRSAQSADRFGQLVCAMFDTAAGTWQDDTAAVLPLGEVGGRLLRGSPELVSLRTPDHDRWQAVLYQRSGGDGDAAMTTALLEAVDTGTPRVVPGLPVHRSVSRSDGGPIYGFRVMFDNGIYYLHYNDGDEIPDWPSRFVLAAALDPFNGPWVENRSTVANGSTYFTRGRPLEPDNGAIWQGCMVKHRGRYYLYYENYHSLGNVDAQYRSYYDPQAGSRVGFATA